MSYTLHIWNHAATTPLSQASLAEITGRLQKLAQMPSTEADKALFCEFGRRIWGLYPSVEEQNSAKEIFFSNPECDGRDAINRLWTIQLHAGNHLRVLRDIAQQAQAIGLAVYDDQIGIGFDPHAGIVPAVRLQDWQAVLEGLKHAPAPQFDKAYIRKHIIKHINEKLVKLGFTVNRYDGGYVDCTRDHGQISQKIAYSFSRDSQAPRFGLSLLVGVEKINYVNNVIRGGGLKEFW